MLFEGLPKGKTKKSKGRPSRRERSGATKAVRRTVPTGLLLYSLIVLWHECIRKKAPLRVRKWSGKDQASFADMLAGLRADSLGELRRKHLSTPGIPPGVHKFIKPLEYLIALAA